MLTRRRFLAAFGLAGAGLLTVDWLGPKLRFNHVVLHHTASGTDNYASIRRYHNTEHGWRDAGYHLILSNGSTEVPFGHLEATGRFQNQSYAVATRSRYSNLRAIHLCVVGNYDIGDMDPRLATATGAVLNQICRKYGIPREKVILHRQVNATTCPGKHVSLEKMRNWMADADAYADQVLEKQHQMVLDDCSLDHLYWLRVLKQRILG